MRIREKFPNFELGLMPLIGDKNPVLASSDSKKLSYFLALKNFKRGFDFYEIDMIKDRGVVFNLVTMVGFKTVVTTSSHLITNDLSEQEWYNLIFGLSMDHFAKEEYQALKMGYVKKSDNGCMSLLLFVVIVSVFTFIQLKF